jgi:hypothetical protein
LVAEADPTFVDVDVTVEPAVFELTVVVKLLPVVELVVAVLFNAAQIFAGMTPNAVWYDQDPLLVAAIGEMQTITYSACLRPSKLSSPDTPG